MSTYLKVVPMCNGASVSGVTWLLMNPNGSSISTGNGSIVKEYTTDTVQEYLVKFSKNGYRDTFATVYTNTNEQVITYVEVPVKKTYNITINFTSPVDGCDVYDWMDATLLVTGTGTTISGTYQSCYDEVDLLWTTLDGDERTMTIYNNGSPITLDPCNEGAMTSPGVYGVDIECNVPGYNVTITDGDGNIIRKSSSNASKTYEFRVWDISDGQEYSITVEKDGYGAFTDSFTTWDESSIQEEPFEVTLTPNTVNYVTVTAKDSATGAAINDFNWWLDYNDYSYSQNNASVLKYSYNTSTPQWTISKTDYYSATGTTSQNVSLVSSISSHKITVTVKNYDTGAYVTTGTYEFRDKNGTLLTSGNNTTGTFSYAYTSGVDDDLITYKFVNGAYIKQATVTVEEDTQILLQPWKEKYVSCMFKNEDGSLLPCSYQLSDGSTIIKTGTNATSCYYQFEGAAKTYTVTASATGYTTASKELTIRMDTGEIIETDVLQLTPATLPSITLTGSTNASINGGLYSNNITFNNFTTTINPTFTSDSWISGISYSRGSFVFTVAANEGAPRTGYINITQMEGDTPYTAQYTVKQQGKTDTYKITLNIKDTAGNAYTSGTYRFENSTGTLLRSGSNTTGTVEYSFAASDNIPDNKVAYVFTADLYQCTALVTVQTDTQVTITVPDKNLLAVQFVDSEGVAIPNVTYVIKEIGAGVVTSGTTGTDGKFVWDNNVTKNAYAVVGTKEGYNNYSGNISVQTSSATPSYTQAVMTTGSVTTPTISVSNSSISCDATGTTVNVGVTLNGFTSTGNPTINAPSWVSASFSATSPVLTVVVPSNNGDSRTGTILLTKYEGTAPYTATITINQSGKDIGYLTVGGTLSVNADDTDQHYFTVTSTDSTTEFAHTNPSASWLTIESATTSNGVYKVYYHCSKNTSQYSRSTTITVTQGGLSKNVTIWQDSGSGSSTLNINPSSSTISNKRQNVIFNVTATGNAVFKTLNVSYPSWVYSVTQEWTDNVCTITAIVNANTGSVRSGNILVSYGNDSVSYSLTQLANGATETHPVWKDTTISQPPSNDFLEYHIDDSSSNTLYAAKVYKMPEESTVEWSINNPISNYLGNSITFTEGVHKMVDYIKPFTVVTNTGFTKNYYFYNSWAYKDIPTGGLLSDPIDSRVDARQYLVVSWLSTDNNKLICSGSTLNPAESISGSTYVRNLNNYIYGCDSVISAYTSSNSSIKNYYTIASGDYVLYYTNAYGGWDSILLLASSKKTDEIESFNYRKKGENTKYLNRITPSWNLKTNYWINGEKMYHLLESTNVYLHNLSTGDIVPVVITDTQCEYKNTSNSGRKPYYYEINVEEANYKYRK